MVRSSVIKVQMVKKMTIARRIKEIKLVLHLTSIELANKLDIPVRTIGSYERAEAQPSPKFLTALYEQLNIDVNWLLSGKGNMFLDRRVAISLGATANIQDKLDLTSEQLNDLIELLNSPAKDMLLKLLEVKKGNKEALDGLLQNLQGIKAIYG